MRGSVGGLSFVPDFVRPFEVFNRRVFEMSQTSQASHTTCRFGIISSCVECKVALLIARLACFQWRERSSLYGRGPSFVN